MVLALFVFGVVVEGLYVPVMLGGVTLAPAIGRFAASEIPDGIAVRVLDTCRPDQFSGAEV